MSNPKCRVCLSPLSDSGACPYRCPIPVGIRKRRKSTEGVTVPVETFDYRGIAKAYRKLLPPKPSRRRRTP